MQVAAVVQVTVPAVRMLATVQQHQPSAAVKQNAIVMMTVGYMKTAAQTLILFVLSKTHLVSCVQIL